jgi:hypothetical protein
MKASIKIAYLALILLINLSAIAQHRGHRSGRAHRHHGNKVVVVKRSAYRPAKVMVYHPVWRPAYTYNRRWVYFPKYNFYWDNWRNHYRFWNGTIWVTQATAPPVIVNVNLEKEKHYELKESDDDSDEINNDNEAHKEVYKVD